MLSSLLSLLVMLFVVMIFYMLATNGAETPRTIRIQRVPTFFWGDWLLLGFVVLLFVL